MNLSDRAILVFALVLVLSLGLFRLIREKSHVSEEIAFSDEFMHKLKGTSKNKSFAVLLRT
jgi:hypothetical protein